jgi:hypothetical protein
LKELHKAMTKDDEETTHRGTIGPSFNDILEAGLVEMPTTTTSLSHESFNDTEADGPVHVSPAVEVHESDDLQLPSTCTFPWILQILFTVNGLVIALFMLPLMYIVNTRVQVPVAYVSTYGAFVFLPYSFKPVYAYLSSSKTLAVPRWCSNGRGYIHLPARHHTYVGVLVINSLCIFAHAMIPPGGVVLIFVVGFLRGVTDAWAILCLGLILIDLARIEGHEYHQRHASVSSQMAYDKIVSRFQSQAATLRNVGSVIGGSITFLVFLQRYLTIPRDEDGQSTAQLSDSVANGLLFLICIMQILAAGVAFVYRDILAETETKVSNLEHFQVLQQHDAGGVEMDNDAVSSTVVTSEEDGLIDGDQSQSSYLSTDSDNDNFEDESSNEEARIQRRNTLIVLVIMQVTIVLFVLKDPISQLTSTFVWKVLVVTTSSVFALAAMSLCYNGSFQLSHRVGIFLIARNMVPSDAMVVSSFVYSVFQSQPLLLQSLTVISLTVRMLSSWSYTKLWARFCQGHPLLVLIGGLVVLSSFSSLLNVVFFWSYQSSISLEEKVMLQNVIGIAVLATVGTTFFSEWAFLPEIVLASVAAARPDKQGAPSRGNPILQSTSENRQTADPSASNALSSATIAVGYGSLVACIEFGDQLGALLAAPLVAVLGVTRENGFHNLDSFLLICCASEAVLTLSLLPMLWKHV